VYSKGYCENHIRSLEPNGGMGLQLDFNDSVADNEMANLSFISPNLCDDGHSPCTGIWPNATCSDANCAGSASASQLVGNQADKWLQSFLSPLLNHTGPYKSGSAKTHDEYEMNHTAIFILYDESASSTRTGFTVTGEKENQNLQWCKSNGVTTASSVCGGNIYEVTVIPNHSYWSSTHAGWNKGYTEKYTDYGITATIELLFNLTGADNAKAGTNDKYGLCNPDISWGSGKHQHLSNPGCLDELYLTDEKANPNFFPLFSYVFNFAKNGY
ncbi:MAG: hypothetical protein WCA77_06905, partial [Thermoplasmata archaeon]